MHQISKKALLVLTSLILIVTCISCKESKPYLIKDYLNYLSIKSGIGVSENFDDNYNDLLDWQIVTKDEYNNINNQLDRDYLCLTINRLLDDEDNVITCNIGENINKEVAENVVNQAIDIINNKQFTSKYEYKLKDNIKNENDTLQENDVYFDSEENKYKKLKDKQTVEAEIEDVYEDIDIENSFELDFSNSEVIPYQDELDTSYINNKYELLASKNHTFSTNGYRVSYTLSSSGISVRVSKKVDKVNVFADLSIKNVKTSFKYLNEDGDLKNCYFKLNMNTTEEFGFSNGKYERYYLNFKDLQANDLKKCLDSLLLDKSQEIEARIPICTIKTPIPNVPTGYINLELLLKFNASGKMELVLYNSHNIGFEIKEGKQRFFYEHNDDIDAIIRAGGKACMGVNVGVDAVSFRLCDVELDGGIKAEAKATLHLYENDGSMNSVDSDISLSTLEEICKENPNVSVCGDVSLYWLFDVIINTSKSKLYKLGFTKTYHILDEDNQVFGNLHHIENGQFVKKCTRKSNINKSNTTVQTTSRNKITLNTYAEVLSVNEQFNITIENLPEGYTDSDVAYTSLDNSIVTIENQTIKAIKPGSCKVKVYTKDNKYNTYISVLVSTG